MILLVPWLPVALLSAMNSFSYTDAAHQRSRMTMKEALQAPCSFVEADELKEILQQLPSNRTKEDLFARFEKIVRFTMVAFPCY